MEEQFLVFFLKKEELEANNINSYKDWFYPEIMAYINYGRRLPCGKTSESYVTREPDCLKNISGYHLPCETLRKLFKEKEDSEIHEIVGGRLNLSVEETDIVCRELFRERDSGEWK